MMKCSEVYPNLGGFVLGGLEPEEEAELQRHLSSCPSCQEQLKEFEEVGQALKAAPPLAEDPPAYLKDEILSSVRAEKPPSSNEESSSAAAAAASSSRDSRFKNNLRLVVPGAAAAALIALIVAVGTFFSLHTKSAVATIELTPTENEDYWGVAELHPQPSGNQQVELKLNDLDEPGPDSFYEAWFASGEKYIGAGTFTTTGSGETEVWLSAPPQARNYPTLLITEQSATGDEPAPGEKVILRGELQ